MRREWRKEIIITIINSLTNEKREYIEMNGSTADDRDEREVVLEEWFVVATLGEKVEHESECCTLAIGERIEVHVISHRCKRPVKDDK